MDANVEGIVDTELNTTVDTSEQNVVSEEVENVELAVHGDENKVNDESNKGELPKGVLKRFGTLTKKITALENQLRQSQEYIQNLNSQKPQKPLAEMSDQEYIQYEVNLNLQKAQEQQLAMQKQMQLQELNRQKVEKEMQEYQALVPDLKEVLEEASEMPLPNEVLEHIKSSDIKVMLAYKIAKDESIQDKIESLQHDSKALSRYMLKLELKVEDEIEKSKQLAKAKSAIPSNKPLGSVATSDNTSIKVKKDIKDMTITEYREWKKNQKR